MQIIFTMKVRLNLSPKLVAALLSSIVIGAVELLVSVS